MKQTRKPQVLIILPTLGERLELLEQTLVSITRQRPKPDVVLVCPLKNRQAVKLARRFNAHVVDDPGGLSAAVNAGIATAQPYHTFIGWLGDDDLLTEGSLAIAIAALEANPEAVLAFGYCDYIDANGRKLFTSKAGRLAPWLMTWGPNLVPLPGIVFRRHSLEKAGLFDPKLKYAMDLDVLLRLRKLGPFINTRRTLAAFRWHLTSTTVANRNASLTEAQMVKRRYFPVPLKVIAPLWEAPVRLATKLATQRVNNLASK